MSKYQDQLIKHINTHPDFIKPESRKNEILGFLSKNLQDLCISRPKKRLSWGIELPFDKDYVTYVWFDALINYISAIGWNSDNNKFNKLWPADYHLMAKDIITTHCVYWPTMLMACNIKLPKTILLNNFLPAIVFGIKPNLTTSCFIGRNNFCLIETLLTDK